MSTITNRLWQMCSARAAFVSVVATLVMLWVSSVALAQAGGGFEALLERMRESDPAQYEEIMRRWDRERRVEGPMWDEEDGRLSYWVPVKDSIIADGFMQVDSGEVVRKEFLRDHEAKRDTAVFIAFILGLVCIAGGVVNLCAPQFLWRLRQFSAELTGLKVERTSTWDGFRIFSGVTVIMSRAGIVIIALVMACA